MFMIAAERSQRTESASSKMSRSPCALVNPSLLSNAFRPSAPADSSQQDSEKLDDCAHSQTRSVLAYNSYGVQSQKRSPPGIVRGLDGGRERLRKSARRRRLSCGSPFLCRRGCAVFEGLGVPEKNVARVPRDKERRDHKPRRNPSGRAVDGGLLDFESGGHVVEVSCRREQHSTRSMAGGSVSELSEAMRIEERGGDRAGGCGSSRGVWTSRNDCRACSGAVRSVASGWDWSNHLREVGTSAKSSREGVGARQSVQSFTLATR